MKDSECAESKEKADFSDLYFSSYGHFCAPIFDEFYEKSKNKKFKIDFSFDSAHCASFMKMGAKLRGSAYP